MKKLFINPKTEIRYFLRDLAEHSRKTMVRYVLVGDEGQEVRLEVTYTCADDANPAYIFGKVAWGTTCNTFNPVEMNDETLDFLTDLVVNFYKKATKNTDFSGGIPVTVC